MSEPFDIGDRVIAWALDGTGVMYPGVVASVRNHSEGQMVFVVFDGPYDAVSWAAPDDECIRHAPTAEAETPKSSDPTLTDLRALATRHEPTIDVSIPPSVLLALLDRVEKAEAEVERLAGLHGGSLKAVCNERDAYADALDAYQAGAVPSPETGRLRALLAEAESTIARLTAERDEWRTHHANECDRSRRERARSERTREGLEADVTRLTSEAEALRALVPSRRVRAEILEAFRTYDANGYTYGHVNVFAWLQRIEAARAAEGGG